MFKFFGLLLAKIAAVVQWFSDLFLGVFVALWDVLKDGGSWVFEQVLTVAVSAMGSLSMSAFDNVASWGSLPGEVIKALVVLRVPEACVIIVGAIGIRLALQLIPFTRLGS